MKAFIKLFITGIFLSALLFSYPGSSSATSGGAVGVVVYPQNVIKQLPWNDSQDLGPAYRLYNLNWSNAPFVLVAKVVGYYGSGSSRIRLWLKDDLTDASSNDPTVQTYNRFASGATKSLGGLLWLDESPSAPAGLAWTAVTANTFYVMVVGKVGIYTPNGNPTYSVMWEVDTNGDNSPEYSGSAAAGGSSTLLAGDNQDWYLNWDDNLVPESGDPIPSADYVELFSDSLTPVTTAPVDGNGYFEMVLPDGASDSYSAEARRESGVIQRTWVSPISQNTGTFNELINAGSGAPTAIRLADFKANAAQSGWSLAAALLGLLVLGGAGLFLAFRTAEVRR
jgi:hypothetical protein